MGSPDQQPQTPAAPYSGYLGRLMRVLEADAAAAEPVRSAHDGAPADVLARLEAAVEDLRADLLGLSHDLHAHPEVGHACGHNIIAATAVGAFLALARLQPDLGGSVELIGTPAEEGVPI